MWSYSSKEEVINLSPEKIYNFLADFRNFRKFLPNQITQWESTENDCSFHLSNIGHVKLEYKERKPYSLISIGLAKTSNLPVNVILKILINPDKIQDKSKVQFTIVLNANSIIESMLSNQMQNFVELFMNHFKELINKI